MQNSYRNNYTEITGPQCVFFDVLQDLINLKNSWNNGYPEMASPQYVSFGVFQIYSKK